MNRRTKVGAAGLLWAVLGCSSSTTGSPSTSSATPTQACSDAATALCSRFEACAPLVVSIYYGDMNTCVTRSGGNCPPTFTASGSVETPTVLEACASAINSVSCNDLLDGVSPAACTTQGTLKNGAACGIDPQCASAYCKKGPNSTCGVCADKAAVGGSCTNSIDCASGAACNAAQVCVTVGMTGATCDPNHPCQSLLQCKGGTCAPSLGAGQACDPTAGGCNTLAGLFCNAQSKTCQMVAVVGAGQPCGFIGGGITGCSASAHCKIATGSAMGTCEAPAADGAACDAVMGPGCLSPAVCAGNVCKLQDPASCK